jgi:copper transport protein
LKRTALLSCATAPALSLALPAGASAHAQLEETIPERGAVVKHEPGAVIFRFDEPVEGNFGAVRVYDAGGTRVDEGDAFHPSGEGPELGVHLKPGLPDGSYTATYRVISADGHIVSSGFVFSVGKAGRAPKETVAELTSGSGTGEVTQIAFGVARGLQYAATALGVGGLLFLALCWLPALAAGGGGEPWRLASASFVSRLRRVLVLAAAIGALSAVAGIVVEGAEAAGVSGFSALKEQILRETLETKFGSVWGFGAIAWVVFGILVALLVRQGSRGRIGRARVAAAAVPLLYIVLVPALSGHGSTQPPVALLFPVNVVHVAAMAAWLGGLATLLLVAPRGTRELAPADRGRLLAGALARFSRIALVAAAAILLTGLTQAYAYVRHLNDLLTTSYGLAVTIKLVLFLVAIGFAAYNRRRSVPGLKRLAVRGESPGRVGLMLRRAVRAEVALLVVVLGVTAALAGYAPPVTAQGGPFSAEEIVGPIQLEMSVEPASVGANEVHIYLFDARSGAPYTKVKELRVSASLPGAGISVPLQPQVAGPGHYTIPDALFSAKGTWKLQLTMRVSAFDQFEKTLEVPIR